MEQVVLLGADGELHEDPRAPLEVTRELCGTLLMDMSLARRFDEEALALQRIGRLSLWLESRGQEAAQVGAVRALADGDWVVPSYREHAAALVRGIAPEDLLRQWAGRVHSGWDPEAHRFGIYTLVLGSQLLHAVGMAMAVQMDGTDEVVMACLGDGASSQGDANEAFNWAAVTQTPVVFLCQDNGWAISTPVRAQMRTPLHQRAAGFGLGSWLVDGNDVLAVLAVVRQAVRVARDGGGPVLVHALTQRMGGHSTSDDPTRYRPEDELAPWAARDPLRRLRTLMAARGWLDDDMDEQVRAATEALAQATRTAAEDLGGMVAGELVDHVLRDTHQGLREQREEILAIAAATAEAAAGAGSTEAAA